MKPILPSIVKDSERLLVDVTAAAARFPKAHKYQLGQDLRGWALECFLLSQEAWRASREPTRQVAVLTNLAASNDKLKAGLQVGYKLHCFPSLGAFEVLATQARNVGKQCGAMHKKIKPHLNGQSSPASAPSKRPETLSTPSAHEAQR